ncbi:MAG: CotH kinase family protein, partial [Calditrichota bacterium]
YTTDGSEPSENSPLYTTAISINQTTVLRARCFESGFLPSATISNTYFINETTSLPVISLSSDPDNFWDEQTGIYVLGPNASPDFPFFDANFWEDWERPVHIEFFEPNGVLGFSIDCGVKIFGGWSRGFPQKSLALYARDEYGFDEINYQIFSNKPIDTFESIILRNSGNDWNVTQFRDAMITGLVADAGVDIQAHRPVIVYINGEYWGVHNLREKLNENFVASNHEVDPDNIDLLENDGSIILGGASRYHQLIDFLSTHNLTISTNYDQVKSYMDINNFINYQITEIYCDNTDWPGNNLKFWRSRTPDGVWRWLLYDTDFGFGLYDEYGYLHNTLEFATEENGPSWPNPPWSTFIFRKLLENQEFRNDFINRFADFLNTYFLSSVVLNKISYLKSTLNAEMDRHFTKWGGSMVEWSNNIQRLQSFASLRPSYVRLHIINKFGLSGTSQLSIDVLPSGSGRIRVNTVIPDSYPWTGFYFNDIPVKLTAFPLPGFHFSRWEGISQSDTANITLILNDNLSLTAIFEADTGSSSSIVINEINYNSAPDFDMEDWVEFYNNTGSALDISDWIFKDSDDIHNFSFPPQTILPPDEYLVLCRDTSAFLSFFPNVTNYIGNFDFNISNGGELVRIYDFQGFLIDSLTYDDTLPWPPEPDGTGP